MNKIFMSWQEVEEAVTKIASKIDRTKVHAIYGVPRGGLVLAVLLSHKLDVPMVTDLKNILPYRRVLIVDDISDSGRTLQSLIKNVFSQVAYSWAVPLTATIHYKPGSRFRPDIYYKETEDWIVYPWETEATSKVDYNEPVKGSL